MHSSRCHLDYSFQLKGSNPTAPQLCQQLPRRKARSIHRSKTRRASQKAKRPSGGPYVIPAYYASDFLA